MGAWGASRIEWFVTAPPKTEARYQKERCGRNGTRLARLLIESTLQNKVYRAILCPAMKVKLILPALTEAKSPLFRPIKYSLFPPLGLATLASYLDPDDEVTLQDEHVETLDTTDEPDLVVIQVYITSAYRAYALADHYRQKGAYVVLG